MKFNKNKINKKEKIKKVKRKKKNKNKKSNNNPIKLLFKLQLKIWLKFKLNQLKKDK